MIQMLAGIDTLIGKLLHYNIINVLFRAILVFVLMVKVG